MPNPADPQSWNRYAYVNNSPINFSDPTGHIPEGECSFINGCDPIPDTSSSGGGSGGGPIGGAACKGPNQSVICLPLTQDPLPNSQLPYNPTIVPANGGNYDYDPELEYEFWFYRHIASPFFDFLDAYDVYKLHSKGGYKYARYGLPMGIIEGITAGMEQGYRDRWYQSLTPGQRFSRPFVVGAEAVLTDGTANLAGATGGTVGLIAGPLGAAVGFYAASAAVTKAGDRFWMYTFNPNVLPFLGVWP